MQKLILQKNDEYYTQPSTWDLILPYINQNNILWEPFYGLGHTHNYFNEKGYNIIGENTDFFENEKDMHNSDIVVSNPPFSLKYKIISRLVKYNKPFILILPLGSINTLSFRKCFNDNMDDVSIILPKGRINFIKGKNIARSPSFESCFVCWKLDIPKLVFLS